NLEAERCLIIGLGSGMTCSAVACHPSIRSLDAVEISPEVVAAARLFAAHNAPDLEDPRWWPSVDAAKTYLELPDRTYDIIISEPSNPWMAGVADVFPREFYQCCRAHLQTNGLMAQWIHLYETSDEALDLVLRTFGSVFPSVSLWQCRPFDFILIGSPRPPRIDWQAMQARLAESKVRADLQRIEISPLSVLLPRRIVPARNRP